jgi:hypothetical protein
MPRIRFTEATPGHLCLEEATEKGAVMNIGEPIRELEVEPLLYPAALPAAPAEPTPALAPEPEPAEIPE